MKKINHLIPACIAVFLSSVSFAQNTWDGSSTSTISTNGSIGIGTSPGAYRLNINNTSTTSGLSQNTSFSINGSQYGIANSLNTTNINGLKYGFFNSLTNSSSSNSYGIHSTNNGNGSGGKYGLYAAVNGTGTGMGFGIYATVLGNSSLKYGVFSTVANSGTNNSSTDATAIGIYANGTGVNSRAGYFVGDVELNNGNTIYSNSTNGNKIIFLNHTAAGENIMSFAFNQTNNQYDWGWGRAFQLNRAGEMIKRFDGTGKVFSINRTDLSQDVFRVYGDGKVFATEVNVMLPSAFPDYVFKSDYKLMPLDEVHSYIQSNGHLPNIPAAAEVEKNGLNVGQMTTVLVEKVEELTLYLIEQQALIKQQQIEIEALKSELKKVTN